jgi:hypothetical protein
MLHPLDGIPCEVYYTICKVGERYVGGMMLVRDMISQKDRLNRRDGKNQSVHWKVETTFLGAGSNRSGDRSGWIQRSRLREQGRAFRNRSVPGATRNEEHVSQGGGICCCLCVLGRSEVVFLLAERYDYGRYTVTPSRTKI